MEDFAVCVLIFLSGLFIGWAISSRHHNKELSSFEKRINAIEAASLGDSIP